MPSIHDHPSPIYECEECRVRIYPLHGSRGGELRRDVALNSVAMPPVCRLCRWLYGLPAGGVTVAAAMLLQSRTDRLRRQPA